MLSTSSTFNCFVSFQKMAPDNKGNQLASSRNFLGEMLPAPTMKVGEELHRMILFCLNNPQRYLFFSA